MTFNYSLEYNIQNDFNNISSNKELNIYQMKLDIMNLIVTKDYTSLNCGSNSEIFVIDIKEKITELTSTETTNITNYITNYTFSNTINNTKTGILYQANVSNDTEDSSTYNTIQDALADGKKSIFIKSSSTPYIIDSDINLPNGCQITGDNGIILDFNNQNYSFKTTFLPISYTGDSITFTLNSTTVTGVNTTFYTDLVTNFSDNTLYKKFLFCNNTLYEVSTIVNDTTLLLKKAYRNPTQTITTFSVMYYNEDIIIKNLKIINSGESAIVLNTCLNSSLNNINIENCSSAIKTACSYSTKIYNCNNLYNNIGFELIDSKNIIIESCKGNFNTTYGLVISSLNCISFNIDISNSAFDNNNIGIMIGDNIDNTKNSNSNVIMENCKVKNNLDNGIEINNKYIQNNIPFENICNGNIINNCQIAINGKSGIVIKSELTKVINSCIGFNSEHSIVVKNKNNLLMGNFICSNAMSGIYVTNNEDGNINKNIQIISNTIKDNIERGIYIDDNNHGNSIINGCKIFGNTLEGILIKPSSTTTFTCEKINICNCNIDNDLTITTNSAVTSNILYFMISSNFLTNIIFGSKTNTFKLNDNFYSTLTNGNVLNTNLTNLSSNTQI